MSEEQKKLVSVLDGVHNKLRLRKRKAKDKDEWRKLWGEHTSDLKTLQEYSAAMYELATKIWEPRNTAGASMASSRDCDLDAADDIDKHKNTKIKCRLEWVVNHCREHFELESAATERKLKLLDVGSCYNPFSKFDKYFDIVALDLCPAPGFEQEVFQCDFLELGVDKTEEGIEAKEGPSFKSLKNLPQGSFDVVVFSYFLEYLADPEQRVECCKKANKLLKENGLLFVLRPDSNRVTPTGNNLLVKRMKLGMVMLGFKRIYFEKLEHLWCMAFKKLGDDERKLCLENSYFKRDIQKAGLEHLLGDCQDQSNLNELFHITQDSKHFSLDLENERVEDGVVKSSITFSIALQDELPKSDCS